MLFTRTLSILLLVVASALIGVLLWPDASDPSLARIREAGVIRIGYAIEPPYAFVTRDGEVSGESPEVAKAIVARLGLPRIDWLQMEFAELIPALQAGRIDVIAAGLFITESRVREVRFSRPTFRVRPALLIPQGNPHGWRSHLDLIEAGARVAVLAGSVEADWLRRLGVPSDRLAEVPDARTGYAAVESGLAAAFMLSSPSLRWHVSNTKYDRTEILSALEERDISGDDGYGLGAFAFRRDDRALARAWDRAAQDYLGSPAHRRLLTEFGFTAVERPPSSEPDTE